MTSATRIEAGRYTYRGYEIAKQWDGESRMWLLTRSDWPNWSSAENTKREALAAVDMLLSEAS